jgi:DNA-binding HxlR family transcriptional regulator
MTNKKEHSTYSRNERSLIECDLTYAIKKIEGRWKLQILDTLERNELRFSELKKEFPLITERMLTLQLRALEVDSLIRRTVYAEVPVRVVYALSDEARKLTPILKNLSDWGAGHKKEHSSERISNTL